MYNTIQFNCLLYRAQSTGAPYSRAQCVSRFYYNSPLSVDVVSYFHSIWGFAALLNAHPKNSDAQAKP